jgi:flagellar hook protein FlgE
MAFFGSLLTGVTGLRANQSMLDVIGNNLANSSTSGYKTQRVRFADLFYQTLQPPTPSTQQAGGLDPIQVGFGAKMSSIDTIDSQGTLQPTGRDLDMGIQGAGMFQLSDGSNLYYTRAGSFDVDSMGILRDPSTGFDVQRFGTVGEASSAGPGFQVAGDPRIHIPFGSGIPGQVTSNVSLVGNLDATAAGVLPTSKVTLQGFLDPTATGGTTVPVQVYDATGNSHTLNLTFTPPAGGSATDKWTVAAAVPAADGSTVSAVNPATVTFTNGTLSAGTTATLTLTPPGASSGQQMTLDLSALTDSSSGSPAAASATQNGVGVGTGSTVPSAIQIFDSKGTGHVLSLTFTKMAANPSAGQPVPYWQASASVPSAEGSVTGTLGPITFNNDGSPKSLGATSLTFDFSKSGAAANQVVSFNVGAAGGFTGLTEFGGNSTAAAINQNGFASGTLTTVNIAKDGTINGVFSNGKVQALAQLAVASFANEAALTRQGNNLYTVNAQSGQALVGPGLNAGRGSVQQGVLEQSNVDVANEFTQLIIAQRGFSVNARTITVSDQVLQELTNIIR